MRIGELARTSGATPRQIRGYEAEGLIAADRDANGYRTFSPATVERVRHIRTLLACGLPLCTIRTMLPCLSSPDMTHLPVPSPEVTRSLQRRLERIESRLVELDRTRAALSSYLAHEVDRRHEPTDR